MFYKCCRKKVYIEVLLSSIVYYRCGEKKKNIFIYLIYLPPPHVYPLGQQCTPSEQQTAFGKGQHPYSPDESLQQVLPLGHADWPSGQTTFCNFKAVVFREALITSLPLVQLPENIKRNF